MQAGSRAAERTDVILWSTRSRERLNRVRGKRQTPGGTIAGGHFVRRSVVSPEGLEPSTR